MGKRHLKLLASLTSLVLVLAVMAIGVWAAASATVSINGTVNYTASGNIRATVTLTENDVASTATPTVTGGAEGTKPTATAGSLVFAGGEEAGLTGTFALGTGGTITLTATEGQTANVEYSYSLTIKNDYTTTDLATNKSLQIVFTLPTADERLTITTPDVGGTTWTDNTATRSITLAPQETATITVAFSGDPNVTVTNLSVASSLSLSAV